MIPPTATTPRAMATGVKGNAPTTLLLPGVGTGDTVGRILGVPVANAVGSTVSRAPPAVAGGPGAKLEGTTVVLQGTTVVTIYRNRRTGRRVRRKEH